MEKITIKEYLSLYLDKKYESITNMANFVAIIKEMVEGLNWVGFYLYDGEKLYLGPFQGKAAVQTIPLGEGVCGISAKKRETLVIDDVHSFEQHIACDESSNSEVVIPLIKNDMLIGVLDIDSPRHNRFDENIVKELKTALKYLFDFL
ncbi:MAG: GAF domain-containing protein [Candidatus Izimaplasma sp.]|nr:GAF domain-containing protein [Candidatus Izimaplasma bacterium]